MSKQDEITIYDKVRMGLKLSYEKLLQRKAALGQDMVFADENGMPRVVPAKEALSEYLSKCSDKH
ncbi:MAG: hypothetical protein K2K76_05975 [Muribaculaceae bacterium]|nr:hypothetical protein [Muribaculaceae bacterium]